MNSISIIGHVGADPEKTFTPTGKQVTKLRVAMNRGKDKTGREIPPLWFRVEFWDSQAEFVCEYVRKGRQIGIQGKLDVEEWETNDGVKKYTLVIKYPQITLCGPGDNDGEERPRQRAASAGGGGNMWD